MGILLQKKLPMSKLLYRQIHWNFYILVLNAPLGYHYLPEDWYEQKKEVKEIVYQNEQEEEVKEIVPQ